MVTSRETAGLPEARVFQVGVTVTRAEQEGEEEVEEEVAEVEVEDDGDDGDDNDGGASPLRFHDANLLPARVRPPPEDEAGFLSPPEMRPGMSIVKGPGSEGAERSGGEAREEDKVFDAATAAALDAADARATPTTASSSSTRAAAAAPPPAGNDVEPFEPRLRAAERAMVCREEGREWGKKTREKPKTQSRLAGSLSLFTRACSFSA